MRVALIYHFFAHYRSAVLRELLTRSEHDYVLFADHEAVDPTIKTCEVEDGSRFRLAPCRSILGPILLQKGIVGLAITREFDAVIYLGSPYFVSTWLSAALARIRGKRVLLWTHGWTHDESVVLGAIRATFYRLAHGLLLYGHTAKAIGIRHSFLPDRLHVIYNSLDYSTQCRLREAVTQEDIVTARRELFGDSSTPVAICSARLTPACRLDLLLQAQRILRDSGHLVNVLLIGDGVARDDLERLAKAYELPVHMYGSCYDERRLAVLTMAANVTVSPGKVGLTAMQSLAYGTPVITHDDWERQGPEFESIIPGRTGDLFRADDAHDLADRIRTWTAESFTRTEVRRNCQTIIDRFYNPEFQRRAIDRAVAGLAADDLFWMREAQ